MLSAVTLAASFVPGWEAVAYASAAFGSVHAIQEAWETLAKRKLDVHVLMLVAALGALASGHPREAAILLFLFALSETLESFAMAKTQSAIEGLVKLRPDSALRVTDKGEEEVPVESLVVGDHVKVLPFQGVPVDGEVFAGNSSVDESAMTGESRTVPKQIGDRLLAGTQNLDGVLTMSVTAAHGQTMLEKIVELVRDAQENKASGERISEWFGQRYTFFVIGAAAVAFAIRLLMQQPTPEAFYAALTLLVALSPCALVISVPATTLSALAWSARNGMLVRGGEFIENAGQISTVFLDKTGTLTAGTFELVEVCVCAPALVSGGVCREDHACWHRGENPSDEASRMLAIAAALESASTHPLATAIVEKAKDWEIPLPPVDDLRSVPGHGVEGLVDGQVVRVGQRRMFESWPPEIEEHINAFAKQGFTTALLQVGDKFAALALADKPRAEATRAVESLRRFGVKRVAMLTGDQRETANAVANEVGVEEVHAALLPADKERLVREAVANGEKVMFVGDGVNDAPALALAHVGVAMGGLGSDIALNAADVVIMQDRLDKIPDLLSLGKRTNGIIRANLLFAGGVIGMLALISFAWDWVFPAYRNWALPIAVVGHEGSTVLVILNGLRLLAHRKSA
ncbi:MAG: cation-translocating P-type ATPase [Fimbriimonadaceae bacterium]|nr:cation-translocating P-type ATPase [Fimbriimonadaceae bacterium]